MSPSSVPIGQGRPLPRRQRKGWRLRLVCAVVTHCSHELRVAAQDIALGAECPVIYLKSAGLEGFSLALKQLGKEG